MALSFLGGGSSAGASGGGIGDIFSAITPLLSILGGNKTDKAQKQAIANTQRANSLYEALLQPNNSLVKQMTQDNLTNGMQQFLMQLKSMQMSDNRNMGRGLRGTFFAPERADDTLNYLTSRGLPGIAEQARKDAVGQITSTAQNLQSNAPATNQALLDRAATQNLRFGANVQGFGNGLQTFLNLFNGNSAQEQEPVRGSMSTPSRPSYFSFLG